MLNEALKVAMPGTEEEANIHHLLGTVYQQQRKYDDAIAEFQAAFGEPDATFERAWIDHMLGVRFDHLTKGG